LELACFDPTGMETPQIWRTVLSECQRCSVYTRKSNTYMWRNEEFPWQSHPTNCILPINKYKEREEEIVRNGLRFF
jgi:hypothetical protein